MRIHIINGPNLNLLGTRQPEIYGDVTMDEVVGSLREKFPQLSIEYFQSNHEGAIIDKLHQVGFASDGIILNAGGLTHTSISLGDAVKSISSPVVEVHISDIYKREEFRHFSYVKEGAKHQIVGKGTEGYSMAVQYFLDNKAS